MGKKGDLSDFERGMVVGARQAGLSISKLLIYWDFHAQPSLGFTENGLKRENIQWAAVVWTKMPCWCLRRMGRLVRDDRKATVTQITTRYNQDMQNTISEHTTLRTLKQMGYSSRRPHRVPLLSAKNRKRRLQFTQAPPNGIIEDWKNVAWSDESWFLLRHSDCRVSIHGQQLWWTILQLACQLHAPSKRATSVALCCVINCTFRAAFYCGQPKAHLCNNHVV